MLQSRAMRTRVTFLFACLVVLSFGISAARAQDSADLLSRVNNLRASQGVWAYRINGALNAAAQSQAQWIVDTGNVSHTRPDGSGPRSRALAAGYPSAQVSENIYGGTNGTVDTAWTFWINSGIHYAGLVSQNYDEVGIGVARGGWGAAFVMVFGNSGGAPPPAPQSAANTTGGGGGGQAAPSGPPSYVLGVDENGNIRHQVQPGDTLGDIALIYGLTWDDIPYMMQINNIASVRDLVVGSEFLVPPRGGTPVPTPDTRPPTEPPPPSAIPPTITPFTLPTNTPVIPTAFALPAATIGGVVTPPDVPIDPPADQPTIAAAEITPPPTPTPTTGVQAIAFAATGAPPEVAPPADPLAEVAEVPDITHTGRTQQQTWLLIALGVQVVIIVGAGFEFMRRAVVKRERARLDAEAKSRTRIQRGRR